jgi:hypothetical protein
MKYGKGYTDVGDIEKAVDALAREIPLSAGSAVRALESLRRVIQDWKNDNQDDGK